MSDPRILMFVHFTSALPFDEVLRVADERADDFRALGGLQQKYYVHDPESGEVGGVYLWESAEALDAYRTSALRSSIAEAYHVVGAPAVQVFDIVRTLRPGDDAAG